MADYKIGVDEPKIRYDRGSGHWGSKKLTLKKKLLKKQIKHVLNSVGWGAYVKIFFGENARNHMRHYFENKGKPYRIETVEKMVKESASARSRYEQELSLAKRFIERLPDGIHHITSQRASQGYHGRRGGRGGDGGNRNWHFAVGAYSAWGMGTVEVEPAGGGKRRYTLHYEYKFRDLYNWNKGDHVKIGPVTIRDEDMGEFHRQGLAREFYMYGSWPHVVRWVS